RRAQRGTICKYRPGPPEAEATYGLNPAHEEPLADRQRQGSIAVRHADSRARRKYGIADYRKVPGRVTDHFIELIVRPQASESQFCGKAMARAAFGVGIEVS